MIDYYEILNIPKDASLDEIKKAFRKLSKQYHPDTGGDREIFESIKAAYDTLSDPEKREYYDTYGTDEDEFKKIIDYAIRLFKEATVTDISNISKSIEIKYWEIVDQLNNQMFQTKDALKDLKKVRAMILKSPKNNFLGAMMDAERLKCEGVLEAVRNKKELAERAYQLLTEYDFEVIRQQYTNFMTGATTSTTAY